jgi:3-hydroxyacyl-CoA dehydrogenase
VSHSLVTRIVERRVAVLSIDSPPVNALSRDLRQALCDAMTIEANTDDVDAVILIGKSGTFIAGADLREFDRPLTNPTLPDVVLAIETCPKPIIAAIDGAALGGGFEIAMACDGRVASQDAVVGLPEGAFGVIPGSGGTVRLVRLTDGATALELLSTCRRVKADEARELGLVDHVASDLRMEAINFALSLGQRKLQLRNRAPRPVDSDRFRNAVQSSLRRGRNRPFAVEQVNAIKRAIDVPFDVALAEERATFVRLRASDDSAALRYLFFAEREAKRIDDIVDAQPLAVRKVAVVGAGTMGLGIAATFLAAGYPVVLTDASSSALEVARERITQITGRASLIESLSIIDDFENLKDCDLLLEAVYEDFDTKAELMGRLGQIARPGTILASNTSYLNLDNLAIASGRPETVIGLHFFAPAHKMKLLEIVRGARTTPVILRTALDLARRLGKVGVVSRVGDGFIGNRIYNSYRAEAEAMLLEGATPWEVDNALEELGFAMGPFAVSDLSGLDIAWANRRRRQATLGGSTTHMPVLEWLVLAGRLGRKTGAGWYTYLNGTRAPDPVVIALIDRARSERSITARILSIEEIQNRAMAALVNEALLVLEEGIAAKAADIDLVLVHGYGFPRNLGGPLYWAAKQPRESLAPKLSTLSHGGHLGNLSLVDC